MPDQPAQPQMLQTATAKYPLEEYHLSLAGREWVFLHTGLLLTAADESAFFDKLLRLLPYGVALWPSSIALALEMASRGEALAGKTILELGAGTGLPGIVAASFGAHVVQTDQQEMAMSLCKLNAQQNAVTGITHRLVDWTDWQDTAQYDYIIGSDILYGDLMHPHLRQIFDANLASGGHVVLSDPLRKPSLSMFDVLEEQGWDIDVTKWELGEGDDQRTIAIFEMARWRPAMSDADVSKARVPLEEYQLSLAGRDWSILHTGLHLTPEDEDHFFSHRMHVLPYGVALWSSGIALAYEVAARGAEALAGKTILELGAGIGLPGIVAASFGAHVVQTDNQELAMSLCQVNAQRNGVEGIEYGMVDWVAWTEPRRFDYILGADILYGDALHPHLWHIFETNLAHGGHVLLTDPMRGPSKSMFDAFDERGWIVDVQFLEIGDGDQSRTISLFDASPP